MMRQYELVERVRAYDPGADEDALNKAYVYTMKAHGSQTRASGDPYFSHPIEVAGILTDYKLDASSIVTALLHDTVEDTVATLDDIEKNFGRDISRLVDGVTKLSRIELQSDSTRQAENLRKFVLAMSDDIRVLLVKLADRLHNMRTLHHVKKPESRRRIALETMEIYAPLAERIGMHEIKDELEDLAFTHLNPDARESVLARLRFLREEGGDLVSRVIASLEENLAAAGLNAKVTGREKSPYSIWNKMESKNVGFEQLADIIAFRVLVDSIPAIYQALGVIHGNFRVVPGRFKDYISNPKPNGYRSLHTCVIGPEQHRIEVQIRTHQMHDVAERGVAAHWQFKQGEAPPTEGRQYRWMRELLDILDHASGPEEFLEHTKLEMFRDQVFCFSPKGDVLALPRGATPVDFAYAVHSEVGDTCVGARINGRMMPLRTQLKNGDQVEVVTSKAQTPSPTWERFVVTGKARARIRRFIRTQQRAQYVDLGRSILDSTFRQSGYELTDKALEGVLKKFKCASVDDLIADVGKGVHTGREVVNAVFPGMRIAERIGNVVQLGRSRARREAAELKGDAVPIRGLIPGMAVHYGACCHPLPGDRIVGIVTKGRGVNVHTIDCEQLGEFADDSERWLDLAWDVNPDTSEIQTGRIRVVVVNEPGALGSLCTLIGQHLGNISNLKITNRSTDFFEMMIDIEVRDVKHLTGIIAALRANQIINTVDRVRG